MNQADSEVMAGYLLASGKYRAGAVKDADVVIVNSCTVKNRSEASFMKDICMIGKPLVLAGCVPEADKERFADHTVIGTEALHMIVQACDSAISGESKRFISEGRAERLGIPKARRNPAVEIIPVSEGCLGNCTYCKVKQARGELDSYQPDAIKMQAISAVSSGAKEIWLTSQDMGCYGMDIGSSLPELIQDVSSVEGDFMIRVGMCNPNFALPLLPSLLEAFKSKKVFKYVHLPVQAGSDRVLQKMGRKYSKADFFTVVDAARSEFPDITIASDVICGFPGETDEEFQETMALVRQLQPDVLNISRFWPRPGTAAAMMEQLSGRVTNSRSRELTELFRAISAARNRRWIGWEGEIIIDQPGKGRMMGRNFAYKPVVVQGRHNLGERLRVRITDAGTFDLKGESVENTTGFR